MKQNTLWFTKVNEFLWQLNRYFLWRPFLHSQELENRLRLQDGTLEKILGLAKSIEQNTSSAGQKIIKEDIKSLKCKQKDLEHRLESAKQEMENYLNSILKSKCSTGKKEEFPLPGREKITSDSQESTQGSAAVEKLEEDLETNKVSACDRIPEPSRLRMKRCGIGIKPSDFIIEPFMCWPFMLPTCKESP